MPADTPSERIIAVRPKSPAVGRAAG